MFGAAERESGPSRRCLVFVALVSLLASGFAGYYWLGPWMSGQPGRRVTEDATEVMIEEDSASPGGSDGTATRAGALDLVPEVTRQAVNAKDVIGKPDGHPATLLPGGTVALRYREGMYFYDGPGPDVRIYGPRGGTASYTLFARDAPTEKWVRFDSNRRGFPTGAADHDFGHHGLARAGEIMVRNDASVNLNVDAIVPLHERPGHRDD